MYIKNMHATKSCFSCQGQYYCTVPFFSNLEMLIEMYFKNVFISIYLFVGDSNR